MSARSYTLAKSPAPPRGWLSCVDTTWAIPVGAHLAVRRTVTPHDAGEGLAVFVWVVDHVSSGYRAYGRSHMDQFCALGGVLRVAKALRSAPVDWSAREPRFPESMSAFLRWAEAEIEARRSDVTWRRFVVESCDA